MEELTKNEKKFIINLIKAEKGMIGFFRGFGKLTKEEQRQSAKLDKLIDKINNL